MKAKVYLSDEGYGHIVRQEAILEQLTLLSGNKINFTVQTEKHIVAAKHIMSADKYVKKYKSEILFADGLEFELVGVKVFFDNYRTKQCCHL